MSALVRSSVLLSLALVLGRLLGFVREVILAGRLGVSAEADLAVVILTLPDLLVSILLLGGFTGALVPALRRAPDDAARDALFRTVATWAVLFSLLLAAPALLLPGATLAILAPAVPHDLAQPWRWAIVLGAATIPLAALSGVLGGYLNARGRFFVVGLGAAAYNLVLCLVLIPFDRAGTVLTALSLGVAAAAAVRIAILIPAASAPVQPRLAPAPGADLRFLRIFLSGVLSVGILFASYLVFRTIAAWNGAGELATFAYALRLYQLPLTLVIAPVATVMLPRLSEADVDKRLVRRAFGALILLVLATLAVGLTVGDRIAALVYLRGAMTEAALADIVRTTTWMFAALPFAALGNLGAAVLNGRQETGKVLQNAAAGMVLGVGLALLRPDMVLAGFILFHVTVALLNLWRARSGLL